MKKCDAYYRRKALLQSNQIELPTQSEILQRHKEHLTNVLNKYIGEPIQLDVGVTPKLTGAKDDLWVSPSDLLIPHVRLKPPLTNKHVRALTHDGILAIGRETQEKYQNEILDRVDVEMRLLADKLNFVYRKEITKAVLAERINGEQKLSMELNRVEYEYKNQLKEELNKLRSQLLAIQQQELENQKQILLEEARQRKKDAINETANYLLKQYQYAFDVQAKKHTKNLAQAIRVEEEKLSKALKNANADKLEALRILRHDLECRNMANLMYILTAERNRCENEKQKIYNEYKILIDEMISKALDLYKDILGLESSCNNMQKKIHKCNAFIEQILCEFQYFINYTFESTPSQCEYLLNLHQFVRHHIQKDMASLPNVIQKQSEQSIHKLTPNLLKLTERKNKEWLLPPRFQTTMNTFNGDDNNKYAIKTLDDDSPLSSRQTLSSKTELTHLLYNKYIYVREDFRNRKTKEFSLKGHNIWKSQSDTSESSVEISSLKTKRYPTSSTVHFHLRPTDDKNSELSRNTSMQISERQTFINASKESDDNSAKIYAKHPQNQRRTFFKPSNRSTIGIITAITDQNPSGDILKERSDENLEAINVPVQLSAVDMISEHTNKHSSKLMVAKNSFILHKYSEFVPQDLNEFDEAIIEMNGNKNCSKPLITTSLTSFLIESNKDDDLARSRLSLVRNSVEIIRQKSAVKLKSKTDLPSPSPKNKTKTTASTTSILFNLLPIDEVISYKSASPKNFVDSEPKNTLPKRRQKSKDNGDTPIITMPSKLSLATDSLELLKRKSSGKLKKSSTKATKDDNKSILNTQNHISADRQSIERSSTSSDAVNIKKNEEIMMKADNSRRLLQPKSKTSRVAIIEEPVNVIQPVPLHLEVINLFNDFDTMNPFLLNHLDIIDKQDLNEPEKYYYPLQLQQHQQKESHQSTSNNSNRLIKKDKIKSNSSKNNVITSVDVDDTNLTQQEFIRTRKEFLNKFQ